MNLSCGHQTNNKIDEGYAWCSECQAKVHISSIKKDLGLEPVSNFHNLKPHVCARCKHLVNLFASFECRRPSIAVGFDASDRDIYMYGCDGFEE